MDSTISQITVSAVIVWLIEKLKLASWFPGFTQESSQKLKQIVGVLAAGAAALGVTYTYDPVVGILTISGLTVNSMFAFSWAWLQNFVSQQILYHGLVKNGNGGIK